MNKETIVIFEDSGNLDELLQLQKTQNVKIISMNYSSHKLLLLTFYIAIDKGIFRLKYNYVLKKLYFEIQPQKHRKVLAQNRHK